ncbi:MAG: PLP-dependent aminotransferase family protein [Lachnospiraceae bacterium]|nr:PLP-dependent aminotransferase family protein [Lachnospiraceae bacterium]
MNYLIDAGARVPAYLQLYALLKADIVDGTYPYGSRLPSKRTVSEETGVSVVTAAHAYALLSEEGYAEARERSGFFAVYRAEDFPAEAAHPVRPHLSPSGAVRTAAEDAEPHPLTHRLSPYTAGEFPFSVLAKTVRRVLSEYGEDLLVRSPNHGCGALRAELAAYLARSRSIHVRPGQIIVGSGAEYLYGLIAQLFGHGASFALESPSYEKIRQVYEACGIRCEMIPLAPDGIDTDALRRVKTAVLHTTPFHNYPTGITAGASKKREILRWAAACGAFVVEDNYDSELTVSAKPEDSLFSMSDAGNVIYVNTFTRTIAPSVRIGYMVLPEKLEALFTEKLGFYACPVPLLDQYVLAELLRSGDYERHVNRVRRQKRKAPA